MGSGDENEERQYNDKINNSTHRALGENARLQAAIKELQSNMVTIKHMVSNNAAHHHRTTGHEEMMDMVHSIPWIRKPLFAILLLYIICN